MESETEGRAAAFSRYSNFRHAQCSSPELSFTVASLRPPADTEEECHAGVVVGDGWREGDVVQVYHEGGREGDFGTDLIFQRHAEGNEMARVVAIDFGRAAASIEVRVENA